MKRWLDRTLFHADTASSRLARGVLHMLQRLPISKHAGAPAPLRAAQQVAVQLVVEHVDEWRRLQQHGVKPVSRSVDALRAWKNP